MKRKQQKIGVYGIGKGVYISHQVRTSAAYAALSATERLILFDFIGKYYRASSGDKTDIRKSGFAFTMRDTLESADAKTFYRARARICAVGFFKADASLKRLVPASPDVYVPSSIWRDYTPDSETAQRIAARSRRKAETIERGRQRRRAYMRDRGGAGHE